MKRILNLTRQLPFTYSFKAKLRSLLPVKIAVRNLGNTFYPRIIQIYQNVMEALVLNNTNYIKVSTIPELAAELTEIKTNYRTLGYKLKLSESKKKLLVIKNYIWPQTVFKTQNFYISLVCKVYFGGQFDPTGPYKWPNNQRVIRFGKHRYIIYDKFLPLSVNLSNIFSRQIYEFIIQYQSNLYIDVMDMNNNDIYKSTKVNTIFDEDDNQDLSTTQIKMRSSSEKFDWIIVDINQILQQKHKKK